MHKKSIYNLREELIRAEKYFDVLHIYGDHAVLVLKQDVDDLNEKKQALKEHIETRFKAILHVDVFTQYIVVWHEFDIIAQEHMKRKRPN